MAALDHVTITVTDLAAGVRFYDAALGALGLVRSTELVDEEEDDPQVEAAAWGPDGGRAFAWLVRGAAATRGLHLCFAAQSRAQVEAFYDAAVDVGGSPHSAPRRWTPYRRGEFNAIVGDPAGNLVEAVAPE